MNVDAGWMSVDAGWMSVDAGWMSAGQRLCQKKVWVVTCWFVRLFRVSLHNLNVPT